jgi:hypothetical protein
VKVEAVSGLKTAHRAVLNALERANVAHGRMVVVEEIAAAMTADERALMAVTYQQSLNNAIAKVISLLLPRELAFSRQHEGRRCYGAASTLDAETAALPAVAFSRRRLVLALVREAVAGLGRAVRAADVIERAAQREETAGIAARHITHGLGTLVQTGELKVLGAIRGDGRGMNLYLPAEADEELSTPAEPLTWLDAVLAAFTRLWQERERQAREEGRRPRPISTSELRAFMEGGAEPHPKLKSAPTLTNALKQLAASSAPSIRRVARAERWANLWAPADVPDERLATQEAFASDSERVTVAVARAVGRLRRPVTAQDVSDEFERDDALRPTSDHSPARLLTDAAKDCIGGMVRGRRRRTQRVHRHVFRVGNLNGTAYYTHDPAGAGAARAYVSLLRIQAQWAEERASEVLDVLEGATVACVAAGRALLVQSTARGIAGDLDRLLDEPALYNETRLRALTLRADVEVVLQRAAEWLSARALGGARVPDTVCTAVPGWTAEELLRALRPLYPCAAKIETPHELVRLLGRSIRRVPNPAFGSRFLPDPQQAAEYLYDRTDALLFIARQWGGLECCMQANMAGHELGLLRDARFAFPALESSDINERLIAVSCLAFLWSEEGNDRLKQVAMKDCEHGVRASAIWAYAFAQGEWADELADVMRQHDRSAEVRDFAARVHEADAAELWRL